MADSTILFVLQESAAGYALFEVVAFEEIGSLLEESSSSVTDYARFGRSVKLKTFLPFQNAEVALDNANAISEHAMTETLKDFLEMNLPKISSKKKKSFSLGIIDTGLATAISEGFDGNLVCRSDDTIREIIRGCRYHLDNYIKGLKGGAIVKAQLGLGHSYSRSKIKFNPGRSDNMIIQSIALLDQLDKDVNTFSMRLREWYSYHFPELATLVKDNLMYARTAAYIQNKKSLFSPSSKDDDEDMGDEKKDDNLEKLTEIVGDEDIAKAVINAAKTSMGMECSEVDMINIVNFTQRTVNLAEYRQKLSLYLTEKMGVVAPNLSTLIGDTVAARLISKAGSLMNLAKAPASTVQILGAEKALFRALKTKGNTPKYGLIYHSTFIGRADAKNKGRISRYLANKCSIATRIDTFTDEPTRIYGEKLRDQVEERLKFYETGAAPRKNVDVMMEVAKELKAGQTADDMSDDDEEMKDVEEKKTPKSKKKSKKEKKSSSKKKKAADDDDKDLEDISRNLLETPKSKKEKKEKKSSSKKRKSGDDDDDEEEPVKEKKSDKKKKKKRKSKGGE